VKDILSFLKQEFDDRVGIMLGPEEALEVIRVLEYSEKDIECLKEEYEDRNRKILKLRRYTKDLRDENNQIRKEWGVEVGERNARIAHLERIIERAKALSESSSTYIYFNDLDKILNEAC